jgi:hypothetical protein
MLRGESVICGTSSTGTGALTLAATPTPPGGIDFDVWARAVGFGNSAVVPVTYTMIEYTSSVFSTAKQIEKGVGTVTLGTSSGVANASLTRTTPQVTATSLNSQPASYNANSPSAISIGTVANTLIFVAPSAADLLALSPCLESSGGPGDTVCASPALLFFFGPRAIVLSSFAIAAIYALFGRAGKP